MKWFEGNYWAGLCEFTRFVSGLYLPNGEKFDEVISTNYGPEKIYRIGIKTQSGKRFYISFSRDEFVRGKAAFFRAHRKEGLGRNDRLRDF